MPLPPPRISKSRRPSPSPISSDMPTANGDHLMAELHPSSPSPTASDMPMANGNHFMAELPAPVNKDVDFAKYFCTYAYLYYQKVMLSDRVRMEAYYNAVFKNSYHFRNKVVLDVGTGTGILAIWCAQAGAKKVYAVEATKMSDHARDLVKANNVYDVVEVIEGSMEDVLLPEKVDVIISEWMGYFLLRESMFDSVICARDRWLKPDGVMYPSHARMWIGPIRSDLCEQKWNEFANAMSDWNCFANNMESQYGVNMNVLTRPYLEENEKYYLKTSLWNNINPSQVIGTPDVIKEIDCLTVTVDEIRELHVKFSLRIKQDKTKLSGFAGWFDVRFRGSTQNPAKNEVVLTTAPSLVNQTHWGQQAFLLHPSVRVNEGDELAVSFSMVRSKHNHRLMDVEFTFELQQSSGQRHLPVFSKFYIE
ncbi:protein arginine N-methyltransferase PRMT10-like [Dioscorea cayenensis subsp. rotundata]|uniref:Protein arginine N-methyltransferase PRMT10 n=1 Tax=Dioscorea cayennensis subsp. rotundata TaxID=55577 RepID=A0AB40BGR1_DIOCR|nr:protein arginine N-methyltransferase PRMT10-like [Dioscorea cayenensis subsp. rotundata]